MQSVIKRLFCMTDQLLLKNKKLVEVRKSKKMRRKRWRFGIYNLAWRNTVTYCYYINICKHPYTSPVCPLTLPNMPPRAPSPPIPAYATQAQHMGRHKMCLTGQHLPTDWHNKHTSINVDETRTHKQNRSTLLGFFSSCPSLLSKASLHSPSVSERWK